MVREWDDVPEGTEGGDAVNGDQGSDGDEVVAGDECETKKG